MQSLKKALHHLEHPKLMLGHQNKPPLASYKSSKGATSDVSHHVVSFESFIDPFWEGFNMENVSIR